MTKHIFHLEGYRNSVGLYTEFWVPQLDCASAWYECDSEVEVPVADYPSVDRAFTTLFSEEA